MFKPIPEYPDYDISNYGRVYSNLTDILKASNPNSTGYLTIRLKHSSGKWKTCLIHQLVAFTYIGPRPSVNPRSIVVHHEDHNFLNNHVSNLRYVTMGENQRLAYEAGMKEYAGPRGESHQWCFYPDEKILQAFELYYSGTDNLTEISKKTNIPFCCFEKS